MNDYDLIICGGGLAGASLAKSMAEHDARVLVLEREKAFRDRVRGEAMHPWGIAQAKALGIYEPLLDSCGHETTNWTTYFGGQPLLHRDLLATNPHKAGELSFYHPEMQETLLSLAQSAGAHVRRGARIAQLEHGEKTVVKWKEAADAGEARARLVVGADGSHSTVRRMAGFQPCEDPDRIVIAGVMVEDTPVPDDSVHLLLGEGGIVLFFPQGKDRARAYYAYPAQGGMQAMQGEENKSNFREICRAIGVPNGWLEEAKLTGPLAQFHGADIWVEHPAKDGVVLVGDAAAKPDPCWGTGLSLTLLDVRTLRDQLLADSDWHAAIHRYADLHDDYFRSLHAVESWMADLLWDEGPDADARRASVLPNLDQPGNPDIIGLGPESPVDAAAGSLT